MHCAVIRLHDKVRVTFICKKKQKGPYPKRDVVKSRIASGFYGKLESDGQKNLLDFL